MLLCNSNKDACSLEAALDEVDELTSKTQAGIERTLKKVESEGCNTEKYQMEEERIKNMYKLRVLLHHGNKVNFKLPGTSIKEAASEASAKKIQNREEEDAASEASTKLNQYRPNSRYEFRNFRVKNYSLTGNDRMKIEKKDNMMKKELVIPIVDENHKSGIKRACVRKGVTNHEKDSTKSRDTKKRKDMDEYELVDI